MWSVNNLQSLPLRLGQSLVIAHLGHDVPHGLTELRLHLLETGVGVLDGVVEDGRYDDLRVSDPGLGNVWSGLLRCPRYVMVAMTTRVAGACKCANS